MRCREDCRTSDWLKKALCRRYAAVHFVDFHLSGQENGEPQGQSWCWAFAMFAADEFEILGAWPAGTGEVEPIFEDLRNRGILSIRVVSLAEVTGRASRLSFRSWATASQHAEPRVLDVVGSQALLREVGGAVEGVPSPAIRAALSRAGRIHDSLLRGARSREPFASAEAASEFIAIRLIGACTKRDGLPSLCFGTRPSSRRLAPGINLHDEGHRQQLARDLCARALGSYAARAHASRGRRLGSRGLDQDGVL